MFVALQFPFTELRGFLSKTTNKLSLPVWPLAKPRSEFVRSFGSIERRRRGGDENWSGEGVYCQAVNAVRFVPGATGFSLKVGSQVLQQRCVFRRFLADGGAVVRFEIGFAVWGRPPVELNQQESVKLIESCLGLSVRIRKDAGAEETLRLIDCAGHLSTRYLRASTRHTSAGDFVPLKWWLPQGNPVLLVEYRRDHTRVSLPQYVRKLEVNLPQIELSHMRMDRQSGELGAWFLSSGPGADMEVLRKLRIHLFRLHAERECLRNVLRAILNERIIVERDTPASNRLQEYLRDSINLLSKKSRFGISQSTLLEAAQGFEDFVTEGERNTLLAQLEVIRKSVYKNVRNFTQRQVKVSISGSGNVVLLNEKGEIVNKSINIGQSANISGNITIADNIANSFNTRVAESGASDELKKQLTNLNNAVAEMVKHMSASSAKNVETDLETLNKESLSSEPRKKWYELSGEGLLEAAKSVGEIAAPVVGAVKAVLTLLP